MKILLLVIIISVLTRAKTQLSSTQKSPIDIKQEINNEVQNTFVLLDEGQENIVLSQQRDLVLILGNTGSGKSTFLQWLFGDNDKLIAKELSDKTYIIEDGNKRIGSSTIKSKTLFPELVIDDLTDTAYYDCPGFSDTRNTSYDIAATYFVKRVADHAQRIKLVFIVNYSSVRKGVDRIDFMKLLTHATDLIKDIDKFNDSIAMVATKVDNSFEEDEDGNNILIPDNIVINGITEFLVEVKNDLSKDFSKVKYVQLVNVFLLKNSDGSFGRIGLFRRPRRPGPLSKNRVLQKGKTHVNAILNRIVFGSKSVDDFGYTVSHRSKNDIAYLIENIGLTVANNLDEIGKIVLANYYKLIEMVETKFDVFVREEFIDANAKDVIERTNSILISGIREFSRMISEINGMKSPSELTKIIRSVLSNLKLDLSVNETLNIISKQGEYFDFLQLVSTETFLKPKSWVLNVENTALNISILYTKFRQTSNTFVLSLERRIENLLYELSRFLIKYYDEKLNEVKSDLRYFIVQNSMSYYNSREVDVSKAKEIAFILNNGITLMSNISARIKLLPTPFMLKSILNDAIFNISGFHIEQSFIKNISNQVEILNFILMASDVKFKALEQWSTPMENAHHQLSNSLNSFIRNELNRTIENVYSLIKSDLNALVLKMIEHYESKSLKEATNILLVNLKNAENVVLQLIEKNRNENHLFSYVNNILDCVNELKIDKKMINRALKRYQCLEYTQAFSTENELTSTKPFLNLQPFEPVLNFLNESYIWYTFLLELDKKLSEYEIQSDASRYNVANLDDWGQVNKSQAISIDKHNFHQFLDKLNISGEIKNVTVTASRLKALDNVLAINVRSKYQVICHENSQKIVLRGNFIKFRDFINETNVFQNSCNFNLINVHIFVSKTVFIDRDLVAIGSEFKVLLVAPKWEVIGNNRSIILDGADALLHEPYRAISGWYQGSRGDDGKAGLPGGAAGSFMGIGDIFINASELRISANGGRGGRGQDGGHGREGQDGDFVQYGQIDDRKRFNYVNSLFTTADSLWERVNILGFRQSCVDLSYSELSSQRRCIVKGKSGQRGGNGGNGGESGIGGKAGKVEMVELGKYSAGIRQSISPGLVGERGQGGNAGYGGESQAVRLEVSRTTGRGSSQFHFSFLENIIEFADNGQPGY